MRFFFDRNMPLRIARMVNAYEVDHTVQHHDEDRRFSITTPDKEWIAAIAADAPSWVVISGDGRILRNKAERAALDAAKLTFFWMTKPWSNMPIHQYAWKFIRVWPEILENALHGKAKLFEVAGGKALKVGPLR
jgi:hypothetical protein